MDIDKINEYLKEGCESRLNLDVNKIKNIGEEITNCIREGKKIILMGNGGSAADAQHIAAEFVGKFELERKPYPAIALHTNTSTVTAIGNDYGFEKVFERQIDAFANKGDVVIALSTSGNSLNVIRGIEKAKEKGCIIVGITGKKGGKMASLIDDKHLIKIGSERTPIIQEVTITVGHILSKIVEDNIR
ncbi:MAG: D-sedoheptulose-7-phosphate isomerase [Thermoplasmata archaeon]|nr:SIS domain-containing protein [Thermoplasmata archaeon]